MVSTLLQFTHSSIVPLFFFFQNPSMQCQAAVNVTKVGVKSSSSSIESKFQSFPNAITSLRSNPYILWKLVSTIGPVYVFLAQIK
jgi:hypothetical protein